MSWSYRRCTSDMLLLLLLLAALQPAWLVQARGSASAVQPDPATDCALRSLCVDYARYLQPQDGPRNGQHSKVQACME